MDDGQTMRSIVRDDAYHVERVLADGPAGRTELVTLDGEGPLVRKRIPSGIANVSAWAVAMEADEPLLPRIEELYRMPDALVVVYDYVPGESLRELVDAHGRMAPRRAVEVISDVCRAVGVLHERGVVHRDIAPGNVIVSTDGAHLVDLGIARQRNEGQRRDTTTLGTWGFASPEQYGFAQTDARSDVYGIGRLLGYLLTAALPGDEAYEQELDDLALTQPALVQVVRTATNFEPSARFQSAAALAEAAREAMRTDKTPARGPAPQREWTAPEKDDPVLASRNPSRMSEVASQKTSATSQHPPVPDEYVPRAAVPFTSASEAQQYATSTPTSPRNFGDVPLPLRLAVIVSWVLLVGLAFLSALASVSAITTGEPPWKAAHQVVSATFIVICGAIVRETYLAVTFRGSYEQSDRPVADYLRTLALFGGVFVVILFAAALLLPQ